MITIVENMQRSSLFQALADGQCIIGNTTYYVLALRRKNGSGNCWVLTIQTMYGDSLRPGRKQCTFVRTQTHACHLPME